MKELIQITARALLSHSRSKWVNDANFMKAIQTMCEQMFGDDALEEQVEWMKRTMFPSDIGPEEAIKRLQEINDKL